MQYLEMQMLPHLLQCRQSRWKYVLPNVLESMEYRSAFRNFVTNGTPIPAELDAQARAAAGNSEQFESRAGDAINTGNTGAVIPVTIVRQIINTFRKKYGNLYSKVRKLNVQGGVEFPCW